MARQDNNRSNEVRFEISAQLSPNDRVHAEFSGKLSPRTQQLLRQWRCWLPALVTVLTTVAFNLPTPVPRSLKPNIPPTLEMPTGVNQNR